MTFIFSKSELESVFEIWNLGDANPMESMHLISCKPSHQADLIQRSVK